MREKISSTSQIMGDRLMRSSVIRYQRLWENNNKSCEKTTTLARRQPSINSSQGSSFSKVKLQGQGRKVKTYGIMWKVLSRRNNVYNMKALSLVVWKLWPRLKFFKSRPNVKVTRSKIMVPYERSCHKEYKCAVWKRYHFWFESYGKS